MKRTIVSILAGVIVMADLGASEFDYAAPVPGTYTLPAIKDAADGEVLDSTGATHRLQKFTHGRVTVLSFIYTRCGDAKACPYATGVLRELHQASAEDPALQRGLRLVSLSFDPEIDTPARLRTYAEIGRTDKPAAEWHFLTTSSAARLKPILEAYGQAVGRKENPADPTGPLHHLLRVVLIDRAGRIRNIYSSGTLDVRLVLADVRTLIQEQPQDRTSPVRSKGAGIQPQAESRSTRVTAVSW
jgi:protein SCO1/2